MLHKPTEIGLNVERGHLWIEITNGCNLNCKHCYSDSYPGSHTRDRLSSSEYVRIIQEGYEAGFRSIQFIGGEPTGNKSLPIFIRLAHQLGFQTVEVFTNLRSMPAAVLDAIIDCDCKVATSIYSSDPVVHDSVTRTPGSFAATYDNLKILSHHGISVRAGFIEMEENRGHFLKVKNLMEDFGITEVGFDRVRSFGRGGKGCENLAELCGACAGETACVAHDGNVFPCIMSRSWAIGSTHRSTLNEIVSGRVASDLRAQIGLATTRSQLNCDPSACLPHQQDCSPHGCTPRVCYPYQPNSKVTRLDSVKI